MRLIDLYPEVSAQEMLAELVPPREFLEASFDSYIPDASFPSQSSARERLLRGFGSSAIGRRDARIPGFYLDGGFGVGKTHLLVSLYREASGRKLFGSFLAYTSLIGALGFAESLKLLKRYDFIAIDEFELDDPGNTMILSRLINELGAAGVRFAATSNTPPEALGDGRFAADDFQREILGIGASFEIISIDGEDYRHRHLESRIATLTEEELKHSLETEGCTMDDFNSLIKHLGTLHPAKYHKMLEGVNRVCLSAVRVFDDQADALRFVAFIDRAYENLIQLRATGLTLSEVFPQRMLDGAYQKKYRRALSRMASMSE